MQKGGVTPVRVRISPKGKISCGTGTRTRVERVRGGTMTTRLHRIICEPSVKVVMQSSSVEHMELSSVIQRSGAVGVELNACRNSVVDVVRVV